MAKNYEIIGVLGVESTYADFSKFVNSANGDDLNIVMNTPGGDVATGFAMIAAMKSYKGKYPNAKITMEARGILASMGPVVFSSSPVDKRRAEDNVAGMVHNPWMFAAGDSRTMRKTASLLDAYTENYASSLALCNKKKSKTEIRAMMDEETWMFGSALKENGFCDEIIPAGDGADSQASAFALAKTEVVRAEKAVKEANALDESAVAVADTFISFSTPPTVVPGEKDTDPQGSNKGEKGMVGEYKTLAEFQTGSPTLAKEYRDSVLAEERARAKAIGDMKAKFGAKVGAVAELCDKALDDGRRAEDIALNVMALVTAALESPGPVSTGANGTASGETTTTTTAKPVGYAE